MSRRRGECGLSLCPLSGQDVSQDVKRDRNYLWNTKWFQPQCDRCNVDHYYSNFQAPYSLLRRQGLDSLAKSNLGKDTTNHSRVRTPICLKQNLRAIRKKNDGILEKANASHFFVETGNLCCSHRIAGMDLERQGKSV